VNSTAAKIVLGNIFRTVLTAIITFFVTKNVIEADVASKLMRGDTVPLWNGAINLNLTMVVNILVGLAVPIVLPIALGVWSRMKQAYMLIVARSEAFAMSKQELKDHVDNASVGQIIKTVATETAPA
jgi:hypothetical protein